MKHLKSIGRNSCTQRKENQQNLTHTEEQTLTQWITCLTATEYPARHAFIKEITEEIQKQHHTNSATPVSYHNFGNAWVSQFLNHHLNLQTTFASVIFKVFSALLEEHQIPLENVFNMDEIGTPTYYFIDSRISY